MGNLDGTDVIQHTPFDAHERVVRGSHTHGADGYQSAKYEHQEFPKAVFHVPSDGIVMAQDADHERKILGEVNSLRPEKQTAKPEAKSEAKPEEKPKAAKAGKGSK